MSDHLPIYVWGRAARGALELAGQGWGLGATMHADSLPEALDALRSRARRHRCGPRRPHDLPPVLGLRHAGGHVPAHRGGVAPAPRRRRRAGADPPGRDRGRAVAEPDRRPAPARAADAARRRWPRRATRSSTSRKAVRAGSARWASTPTRSETRSARRAAFLERPRSARDLRPAGRRGRGPRRGSRTPSASLSPLPTDRRGRTSRVGTPPNGPCTDRPAPRSVAGARPRWSMCRCPFAIAQRAAVEVGSGRR